MDRCVKHPMRNPFYKAPWPKAYYHPSPERNVTEKVRRKSTLSPERRSTERQSSPDRRFVERAGYVEMPSRVSPVDRGLDESWPDTERSSPSQITFGAAKTSSRMDLYDPGAYSPEKQRRRNAEEKRETEVRVKSGDEPVLSRYLNRFRYARPTSREDRQTRNATPNEFWWRRAAADSVTTTGKASPRKRTPSPPTPERRRDKTPSPPVRDVTKTKPKTPPKSASKIGRPSRPAYKTGPTPRVPEKTDDVRNKPYMDEYTEQLLQKTDRILNWSASTMSSHSDSSVPVSSLRHRRTDDDDVTPRDDVIPIWRQDVTAEERRATAVETSNGERGGVNGRTPADYLARLRHDFDHHDQASSRYPLAGVVGPAPPSVGHYGRHPPAGVVGSAPPAPSPMKRDDILQQWRLKRKLELAREDEAYSRVNVYSHNLPYDDNDPSPRKSSPGVFFTPPHKRSQKKVVPDLDKEPVRETQHAPAAVLTPVNPHQHYLCDILPCRLSTDGQDDRQERRQETEPEREKEREARWGRDQKIPGNGAVQSTKDCAHTCTQTEKRDSEQFGSFGIETVEPHEKLRETIGHTNEESSSDHIGNSVTTDRIEKSGSETLRGNRVKKSGNDKSKESNSEKSRSESIDEVVIRKPSKMTKKRAKKAKTKAKMPTGRTKAEERNPSESETRERGTENESERERGTENESEGLSSPVTSAVNEVVSEHLFAGTPRKALMDDSESDEDDPSYEDDVLLQQLVAQRQQYVKQLSLIDTLLERFEAEDSPL